MSDIICECIIREKGLNNKKERRFIHNTSLISNLSNPNPNPNPNPNL